MTLLAATFFLAAPFATSSQPPDAVVTRLSESELSISGYVSPTSVLAVRTELSGAGGDGIDTLVIESPAGDIDAMMELGRIVRARSLEVRVQRVCAAICVAYLAPAAESLTVPAGSFLILIDLNWSDAGSPLATVPRIEEAVERQNAYFHDLSLDPAGIYAVGPALRAMHAALAAAGIAGRPLLVPDEAYLRDCLGAASVDMPEYTVADSIELAHAGRTPIAFLIDGKLFYEGREVATFRPQCSHSRAAQAPGEPSVPFSFQVDLHFAPQAERRPVPFEFVQGILLFRARVEGREIWAMLDNGVAVSLIDSELARSLGLDMSEPVGRLYTGTGSLERRRVANAAVEIPGQLSFRAPISAVDYTHPSQALGRPVGLVIGKEYFEHLSFLIAPSRRTFQLGPSDTLNVPPDMPHLVLKNDRPQMDLVIEGQPVTVTLDLGYSGMIGLNEAAWNRLGLSDRPSVEGSSMQADGRIVAIRSTTVEEIFAGPVRFPDVTVSRELVVPGHGDGIIGMGLLARYDFAVDIKARRIWLLSSGGARN